MMHCYTVADLAIQECGIILSYQFFFASMVYVALICTTTR